jgi:hypothetical protein
MGAMAVVWALPLPAQTIRQGLKARVIIDNDFAGDPDGLVALAHHLLSPAVRCPLITTSALDAGLARMGGLAAGKTAQAGRDAAAELLAQMKLVSAPRLVVGAETFGASDLEVTQAAHAIVEEAMRSDPLPLFVACGGPLTNVAAALRLEPKIARRLTLVWIGGGGYPAGAKEYNLVTDMAAARQIMERSDVPLWQVPETAYRQFQISVAEMTRDIRPLSPLADWLYARYTRLPPFVELGGTITLGDSPLVLLTALSADSSRFATMSARRVLAKGTYGAAVPGRTVRVYQQLDTRLAIADFAACLQGR